MSGTPLMARSRITSTESTRIFALAPGNEIATTTLGGATEGNWEMGNVKIASPPMNRMSSEITIASAGRWRNFANTSQQYLFRMKLQMAQHFVGSAELVFDLVAVAHLANPFQDDLVVFLEPLVDHEDVVLRRLNGDVALVHDVILIDDVNIALGQNLERCPLWNDQSTFQRRMDQNGAG